LRAAFPVGVARALVRNAGLLLRRDADAIARARLVLGPPAGATGRPPRRERRQLLPRHRRRRVALGAPLLRPHQSRRARRWLGGDLRPPPGRARRLWRLPRRSLRLLGLLRPPADLPASLGRLRRGGSGPRDRADPHRLSALWLRLRPG